MKRIVIIGLGYVGKAMYHLFKDHYDVVFVDTRDTICSTYKRIHMDEISSDDIPFICAPTTMNEDGSCDISVVTGIVQKLTSKLIVIKSTIPPGTTLNIGNPNVVFSPEFCGESTYDTEHEFTKKVAATPFFIFGGPKHLTSLCVDLFIPITGPGKVYKQMSSCEAEMVKYMCNTYAATKVAYVYEMASMCDAFGIDFNTVREGWLLDPRINKSHTAVFADNKEPYGLLTTGSKCLDKDINALVQKAKSHGYDPKLLSEVIASNLRIGEIRRDDIKLFFQ